MQALNPVVIIAGKKISVYLVFHLIGIVVSFFATLFAAKKMSLEKRHVLRLYPWLVYSGFFFAHLYFLATEPHDSNYRILSLFTGLSAPGALIGVVIAVGAYSWISRIPNLVLLDLLMPALAIVLGLGRLGCFALGCCYGKPTDFWLNVVYEHERVFAPKGVPLHPVQIYEFLLTTLLALWLYFKIFKNTSKLRNGEIFTLFLFGYGAERFLTGFLRGDAPPIIAGFVHYHVMGLLLAAASIGLRRYLRLFPAVPFFSNGETS